MDGPSGDVLEIACDESGFSGSNLLDAATPVIAHASVDLTFDEAAGLIAELRSGSRYSLHELKSGQLRRGRPGDESPEWFLSALSGRAHVQLVDKELFLVTRVVDLFVAEPSYAAGTRLTQEQREAALVLYRARRSGGCAWDAFLTAFVDLVRTKRRRVPVDVLVERFLLARDSLAGQGMAAPAAEVLASVSPGRVTAVVTRLARDDRSIPPPLEPLLPALAETVLSWSVGGRRVLVTHDEQSALTADRLRRLQRALADGAGPSPLAGLVMVDSRDDPRVQVADLVAGWARRTPETGYAGALHPFLSPTSLRDPEPSAPLNGPRPAPPRGTGLRPQ